MKDFYTIDYIALFSLVFSWYGYSLYLKYAFKDKSRDNLFLVVYNLRRHWMHNFANQSTDPKIADAQMIAILQRSLTFYITITVFIITGLMAMLSSSGTMVSVLNQLPYQVDNAQETITIKIMVMMSVFIFAFFKLSWSLRQSRYFSIAVFGLPETTKSHKNSHAIAEKLALMSAITGRSFHNAYYAYYFGLSTLSWIVHPVIFIIVNFGVVAMLYRREFKSNALKVLAEIDDLYNETKS